MLCIVVVVVVVQVGCGLQTAGEESTAGGLGFGWANVRRVGPVGVWVCVCVCISDVTEGTGVIHGDACSDVTV